MVNRTTQLARGIGLRYSVALAVALGLGITGFAGLSVAQQPAPPAKKPPEKAPAAAPAAKKAPAAAAGAQQQAQSAWVKLCEKAAGVTRDKDGKEEKKEVNICLTHHERLDGNTGMVLVSAAVRQIEGQDKQHFMVMVPLGMMLPPGMRATIYPPDLWEKVQKNEVPNKEEEGKLKGAKLTYTLCHPAGCTAEIEVTPELMTDLRAAGGLVVFSINAAGQAVAFPVPMTGFDQAYAGAPVDNKQYGEARKALMQQIAARQQQLVEEQKKQQAAPPAAAPPAAAPPAKK